MRALVKLLVLGFGLGFGGAAVAQPQPAPSWAGGYVGALAGAALSSDVSGSAILLDPFGLALNPRGPVAGVFGGFNWQHGALVSGVEIDASLASIQHRQFRQGPGGHVMFAARAQWLATTRGRIGVTTGPLLFYATGGLALGQLRGEVALFAPAANIAFESTTDRTHVGFTLGLGAEAMLTRNVTVRAEYLYVDLGPQRHFGGTGVDLGFRTHLIRGGLVYRF